MFETGPTAEGPQGILVSQQSPFRGLPSKSAPVTLLSKSVRPLSALCFILRCWSATARCRLLTRAAVRLSLWKVGIAPPGAGGSRPEPGVHISFDERPVRKEAANQADRSGQSAIRHFALFMPMKTHPGSCSSFIAVQRRDAQFTVPRSLTWSRKTRTRSGNVSDRPT